MATTLPQESNTAIVARRDSTPLPLPVEKLPKVTKAEAPTVVPRLPAAPEAQPTEAPKDRFQRLQKAANTGEPKALYEFGMLYATGGQGTLTPDFSIACEYLRRAAEKGHILAKRALGDCYLNGKGVSKNETEGLKQLREAAAAKDSGAMNELGAYLARRDATRSTSERKAEFQEAFELFTEARAMGDLGALFNLGVMYMNGFVPGLQESDPKKGASLLAEGALKGSLPCMYNYGRCLESGIGIKRNLLEAEGWCLKAASLGFSPAKDWCRDHRVDVPAISPASSQVPSASLKL